MKLTGQILYNAFTASGRRRGVHMAYWAEVREEQRQQWDDMATELEKSLTLLSPKPVPIILDDITEVTHSVVTDCNARLMLAGVTYPRTCKACGIGPCRSPL